MQKRLCIAANLLLWLVKSQDLYIRRTHELSGIRCKKGSALLQSLFLRWSVKRDSNPRPSGPKPDALPSCAIHRVLYSLLVKQTEGHPLVHLFLKAGDALLSCAIHRCKFLVPSLLVPRGASFNLPSN